MNYCQEEKGFSWFEKEFLRQTRKDPRALSTIGHFAHFFSNIFHHRIDGFVLLIDVMEKGTGKSTILTRIRTDSQLTRFTSVDDHAFPSFGRLQTIGQRFSECRYIEMNSRFAFGRLNILLICSTPMDDQDIDGSFPPALSFD